MKNVFNIKYGIDIIAEEVPNIWHNTRIDYILFCCHLLGIFFVIHSMKIYSFLRQKDWIFFIISSIATKLNLISFEKQIFTQFESYGNSLKFQ